MRNKIKKFNQDDDTENLLKEVEASINKVFEDFDLSETARVVAQIFWLKNREPDVWRDKKDVDLNFNLFESLKEARLRLNTYEGTTP